MSLNDTIAMETRKEWSVVHRDGICIEPEAEGSTAGWGTSKEGRRGLKGVYKRKAPSDLRPSGSPILVLQPVLLVPGSWSPKMVEAPPRLWILRAMGGWPMHTHLALCCVANSPHSSDHGQ